MRRESWVHLVGYVDATDKPAICAGASLFVYPSFYEGFGFPVLEAMALGVPTVTSNRSSLPEVTNGGAYLIDPYNTAELTEAICELVQDETLAQFSREKGREAVRRYSWQETARQFLSAVSRLD